MSDLVEELRSWIEPYPKEGSLDELLIRACDEIDRLRTALGQIAQYIMSIDEYREIAREALQGKK